MAPLARPSSGIAYESYFTRKALRRKPSAIRALMPLVNLPGMISLGGGMPNPKLFPYTGFSVTFPDGVTKEFSAADMDAALQYSPTPGLVELVDRINAVQRGEHNPPVPFSTALFGGSQDGLAKLFDALLEEDDTLLIEAPTYSGSLAYLEAHGCHLHGIPTDGHGLRPDAMADMLDNWERDTNRKKPRVLYTIPTGSNPTGASLPLERKRAVYDIARKHGLLIIEDDPYYYLQYGAERTPSLFSMDTDGRVIRCDSFSKILSAGIRIGTVSGPDAIVNRLALHNQASILHTSGLSQMAVLALFRHWGVGDKGMSGKAALGKLEPHLQQVQAFYTSQCDAFLASADKHLRAADGSPLAEYSRPSAGMFVWMKLRGVEDTMALISKEAVAKKVLMVPGSAFFPGNPATSYVRAAFSTASPEQMDLALQRLGDLLRERQK